VAGSVSGIFVTAAAGQPMRALEVVQATAGKGLDGDRYSEGVGYYSPKPLPGGGRELTLIECEVLESLASEHGIDFTPLEARRNLATRGLRLLDLIGKRFRVGQAICEGVRVCEPCVYIEGLTGKLVNLPLLHRGGLRANILVGGSIRVGDPIEAQPEA
jgi:MOSC domain-containing protein YiiM